MHKRIIGILLLTIFLAACTDKERQATIDMITYEHDSVTVLFEDGVVITTSDYDDDMSNGDVVTVTHLTNGNIKITK